MVLGSEADKAELHRYVNHNIITGYIIEEEQPTFLLFIFLSATAIPNATVTWWFRGKEIGRSGAGAGDLDRNFDIRGHGT